MVGEEGREWEWLGERKVGGGGTFMSERGREGREGREERVVGAREEMKRRQGATVWRGDNKHERLVGMQDRSALHV
jgi:hypothetical protein